MQTPLIIFKFNKNSTLSNWKIINDGVMGGLSQGEIKLNTNGNGVFNGKVSLENNGGFSLLRHRFKTLNTINYSKIVLRIKGDSKSYQFRIKARQSDYYSYVTSFNTTTDWQLVTINLKDMYPAFRGKKLDISNFNNETIEEFAFLIGNKKEEMFKLLIDFVELQ